MIVADYSGQELRILAHVSKDPTLIQAFKDGKDFHQATADKFGVDRTKAKAINFGIAYGKSAYGFSKDWGVSIEEAQKVLDRYFEEFPGVKHSMDACRLSLDSTGFVRSLTGRRRHFKRERVRTADNTWVDGYSNRSHRQAFNFLIQGFGADMIRIALVKILNLQKQHRDWDLRLLFTVHDEIGVEVKEAFAQEAKVAIHDAMCSAVKLLVPIESSVEVGDTYADCK
jgi:DNA polymerase-1